MGDLIKPFTNDWWLGRMLYGFAHLFDAMVIFLSLGFLIGSASFKCALFVARRKMRLMDARKAKEMQS